MKGEGRQKCRKILNTIIYGSEMADDGIVLNETKENRHI